MTHYSITFSTFKQGLCSSWMAQCVGRHIAARRTRELEKKILNDLRRMPDYLIRDMGLDYEVFAPPPRRSSVMLPTLMAIDDLASQCREATHK